MPEAILNRGDAVEWLREIPGTSVDLVITDPPYESLEKHRAVGTTTRLKHSKASSNDWFEIFPNDRFEELFTEIYRGTQEGSALLPVLRSGNDVCRQAHRRTNRVSILETSHIWDKLKIGMGYHYRARYELVLFFEKGKRKLNDLGVPDIIQAPRIYKGYPTEKPVEVSEVLIRQSSQPGELVIDPFVGAGATGVAAVHLQRDFMGNDLCQEAVDITTERLVQAGADVADFCSRPRKVGSVDDQLGLVL